MAAPSGAEERVPCSEAPLGVSCSESMSDLSSGYTRTMHQQVKRSFRAFL